MRNDLRFMSDGPREKSKLDFSSPKILRKSRTNVLGICNYGFSSFLNQCSVCAFSWKGLSERNELNKLSTKKARKFQKSHAMPNPISFPNFHPWFEEEISAGICGVFFPFRSGSMGWGYATPLGMALLQGKSHEGTWRDLLSFSYAIDGVDPVPVWSFGTATEIGLWCLLLPLPRDVRGRSRTRWIENLGLGLDFFLLSVAGVKLVVSWRAIWKAIGTSCGEHDSDEHRLELTYWR